MAAHVSKREVLIVQVGRVVAFGVVVEGPDELDACRLLKGGSRANRNGSCCTGVIPVVIGDGEANREDGLLLDGVDVNGNPSGSRCSVAEIPLVKNDGSVGVCGPGGIERYDERAFPVIGGHREDRRRREVDEEATACDEQEAEHGRQQRNARPGCSWHDPERIPWSPNCAQSLLALLLTAGAAPGRLSANGGRMASLIPWNMSRWPRLFFPIWGGQALSLVGSRLVQFALVWWLTKTTGSGTVLAVASMMAYIPQIVISPFAGALVDRWSRRHVLILSDGSIALATVLLAVLFATGWIEPWHVFVLLFVRAVGGAFHWPAMSASTSLMVPEKHLPRVAGLNQTLHGVAMIVSPPLGAFLLEVLPVQGVLSIDVITAVLAIAPLLFLAIPQPRQIEEGGEIRRTVIGGLVEGLRFAWSWPGMLMLIGALALMNFVVNPAFALLPLYVVRVLDGTAIHLGSLQGVMGVGAILGGFLLGVWGGFKRRILTALLAVAAMGVAIVAMGIAPHGWIHLVGGCLFVCGLMESVAVGAFMATLQTSVPNRMQGRVFSLVGSGTQAFVLLGLALAGPLTDRYGIQIWFVIGGIAYLMVGLGSLVVRPIMSIEARGEDLKRADEAEIAGSEAAL